MEIGKLTHNWGEIASLSNLEWRSYPRETEERLESCQHGGHMFPTSYSRWLSLPVSGWRDRCGKQSTAPGQAPLSFTLICFRLVLSQLHLVFLCAILIFLHRMNESMQQALQDKWSGSHRCSVLRRNRSQRRHTLGLTSISASQSLECALKWAFRRQIHITNF